MREYSKRQPPHVIHADASSSAHVPGMALHGISGMHSLPLAPVWPKAPVVPLLPVDPVVPAR